MDAGRIGALTGLGLAVACGAADEPSEEVVIFAASSLMEAFQELEQVYEDRYPHRDVRLSFAGSHVLRTQIEQGARADLIATADQVHLDTLFAGGLLAQPMSFAVNRLAIVVGSEESNEIQELEDLLSLERIVLGSPQVPVGRYAQEMLKACGEDLAAGILERVVSYEDNARLVRAKVELGEAQAAVVYRSDAEGGRGLSKHPCSRALCGLSGVRHREAGDLRGQGGRGLSESARVSDRSGDTSGSWIRRSPMNQRILHSGRPLGVFFAVSLVSLLALPLVALLLSAGSASLSAGVADPLFGRLWR